MDSVLKVEAIILLLKWTLHKGYIKTEVNFYLSFENDTIYAKFYLMPVYFYQDISDFQNSRQHVINIGRLI